MVHEEVERPGAVEAQRSERAQDGALFAEEAQ